MWCKEHPEKWTSKRRPVLAEIINGAVPAKRQRELKTYGGCIGYNAYLYDRKKAVLSSTTVIVITNSSVSRFLLGANNY